MKTREGSVPDLVRASRAERPATEEIEASDGEADGDGRPRRPLNTLKTAEIDVARDRRSTMMSPIPAMMAESMSAANKSATSPEADRTRRPRDAAAPVAERVERTRRVGDSDRQAPLPAPQPERPRWTASRLTGSGPRGSSTRRAPRWTPAI